MSAILEPRPPSSPEPDRARIEPSFRDLMALAGQARALPWGVRSPRTRQGGQYLSRLRGRGMEYDESRPYQPGDDIRQLDWRVTARTGRPHTKLFREERERPVFVSVDYRHAMFFATRGVFKAVQAARLAALLAWRALYNGDRVAGLVFGERAHHELPPRRGHAALGRLFKLLESSAAEWRREREAAPSRAPLLDAVVRLRRVAKPGSLVFVISDFRELDAVAESELARLAAHADVALIAVNDPLEAAFPRLDDAGALTDARDTLELSGVTPRQREAYAERFERRHERLARLGAEQRMPFAALDTAEDPFAVLLRMLGT